MGDMKFMGTSEWSPRKSSFSHRSSSCISLGSPATRPPILNDNNRQKNSGNVCPGSCPFILNSPSRRPAPFQSRALSTAGTLPPNSCSPRKMVIGERMRSCRPAPIGLPISHRTTPTHHASSPRPRPPHPTRQIFQPSTARLPTAPGRCMLPTTPPVQPAPSTEAGV